MSEKNLASHSLHCPKCNKPILQQMAMSEGTHFIIRCFWCKAFIKIVVSYKFIHKRVLSDLHEFGIVTAE